jgi:hypothetical protein
MKSALALAVLTASTIALAQQTTPPSPAQPRTTTTSTTPQEQTAPPAGSSSRMSETDKQTLTRDCTRQVQASHPSVPAKDIRGFCEQEVNSYSSPR